MPVNIRRYGRGRAGAMLALILLASLAATATAEAGAGEIQYRRVQPYAVEVPPTEARGCYYYRGRRHCGSYCYWEVNGKRYCQRRERDAHSQAPVVYDYGYEPALK